MYRVHPKHHQHIFSPLTMLYNYVNQTKQSINGFLNQYLKPQGRQVLKRFNRYMLLIVLLNIDIKLLLLVILLVFISVKVIKLKPWVSNKQSHQLPVSYVMKLNQIKNQHHSHNYIKRYKSQDKSQLNQSKSKNINDLNITQHLYNSQQTKMPPNINNDTNNIQQNSSKIDQISMKSSMNDKTSMKSSVNDKTSMKSSVIEKDLKSTIITNVQPLSIQHQIYDSINKLIKMYCKFLWFVKGKSLLFIWVLISFIYLFQPNIQNDTYHIVTSTDDGVLQIQSIKKASQYVNYFQLIFLWIFINIILFYQNGTKQLTTQLLQELYTKQYTYKLIKQKKLKTKRLYSKLEQDIVKTHATSKQDPFSQKKYNTFIIKNKQPVDIQQLKDFSHLKPTSHHDDSHFINPRKFSHDDDFVPNSPLSHKQKKTNQKINIDFVNSQNQQSQDQNKKDNQNFNKQNKPSFQKVQSLNQAESGKNTIPSSQIPMHQTPQKKKILQRKNNFLPQPSANDKGLQRKRKISEELKNQQQYDDFKISLLRVQNSEFPKKS